MTNIRNVEKLLGDGKKVVYDSEVILFKNLFNGCF